MTTDEDTGDILEPPNWVTGQMVEVAVEDQSGADNAIIEMPFHVKAINDAPELDIKDCQ